jgi:hypothetical protein
MTTYETNYGDLCDYQTGAYMRPATREQRDASRAAAECDGGAGVILVDERWQVIDADARDADEAVRCYVSE